VIQINLFDYNFRDCACSVFGKTAQNIEYVREQMNWDGITIFTDEYINNPIVDRVNSRFKIGWLHEPYCLHPMTYHRSVTVSDKFDTILTYYKPFLDLPGFTFAPCCGVWVPRDRWAIQPKIKMLSMLYGDKMATEGHKFRHVVGDALEIADAEVDFFDFKGTPTRYGWETKVQVLADYRFTIVIEACNEENNFGEPILDAFSQGTVPIQWGCSNVGDFFDTSGIIKFETVDELLGIVGELTPKLWGEMLPGIAHNLKLVEDYEITDDWIYDHVLRDRFLT